MTYMYDPEEEHWHKCQAQINALFRLEYNDDWLPRHDNLEYPYENMQSTDIGLRANAAMFNVAKELFVSIGSHSGYAVDVGAFLGWASFRLAESRRVVAIEISDHACYGMGSVPRDVGHGIEKVVSDGCYLPLKTDSVDLVFMCSAFHHMHDKVLALNEAYRVLAAGGMFLAIGDAPTPEEVLERTMNDGIRDYEGPPYTEVQLLDWFSISAFGNLELLKIKYCDGMEYLGYDELVRPAGENAIICGRK